MRKANFLEKLLDGAEVEWMPLGDIAKVLNGYAFESSQYSNIGIRVIRISDVQKGKMSDKDIRFYPIEKKEEIKRYLLKENDLVMSLTGNVGRVAMLSKSDLPAAFNQRVACVRANIDIVLTRYLFHFFDQISFENEAMNNATGGGQKNMSTKWLSSYQIPIPSPNDLKKSLAIQAEIVRILDAFTALTAELTAELTARKKQYNHYRDQLLTFSDGDVEWKQLEDICEIGDGNHSSKYPRSDEMVDQGVPFIRGTNMVNGTISDQDMKFITPEKHRELKKGHLRAYDVLIANRGEIGKIAYVPSHHAGSNLNSQLAWLRSNPSIIIPRYLFYILNTTHIQRNISGEGGALQQLTIKNIKLILIPVPSLENQAKIVNVLDKFDAFTNSLQEGLPREIELRQKQYEYYRDMLLNFPKPEEAAS